MPAPGASVRAQLAELVFLFVVELDAEALGLLERLQPPKHSLLLVIPCAAFW